MTTFCNHSLNRAGVTAHVLHEIRTVMEADLKELFGTEIPVTQVIFSGRSSPKTG